MLVLASQSPRRRELFALVSPVFAVETADVPEENTKGEAPAVFCESLAREKARAVFARRGQDVVIGCDTVVEVDGQVLGKPADRQACVHMLALLSGRGHQVHTGVCVCLPDGTESCFVETTEVRFSPIPEAEMLAYAATDEPYDKAGGYGIQGWAARFVPYIRGCYYNVMGLPVAALYQKLAELGVL